MNVLITAPSLNVNRNVSGISSVVGTIIQNNSEITYHHFVAGREDGDSSTSQRIAALGKSYTSLIKTFLKKSIDLVHLNLPLNPKSIYRDYLVFTIAKLFGKKVLLHLHGGKYLLQQPDNKLLNTLINRMYVRSEMVVCLSEIEKEIIEKAYHLKGVQVLENTVDDLYLTLTNKEENSNDLKVLFLGRLHESKGVHVLLDSIKHLMQNGNSHLKFIFCGAGPLLEELLQVTKTYPSNVIYMGVVGGEEKNKMLAAAHIFVLPSLYGEGLPMSLIEAMAAGLVPVVTTDGSMKAIVQHEDNGFIVEKNSTASLTAQLAYLAANPQIIQTVSQNAKAFAQTRFSVKKYISSLNAFYKSSVA